MGCIDLKSIVIPNSVNQIIGKAFYGCKSLSSITIPNSITQISDKVFTECTNLKSITIPNSVTLINFYAFKDCTNLKDVNYNGTKEQWTNINIINLGNEALQSATIHFADDELAILKPGDVNGDGKITAADVTAVIKHIVEINKLSGINWANADVNDDGKITAADATTILKQVSGMS